MRRNPWFLLVFMCLPALPAGAAAAVPFSGAGPHYRASVMAELPGAPEGLASDREGRLYATVARTGEIVRLDDHGGYQHVATVPSAPLGKAGMTLGMEFDAAGRLLVAYAWTGSRFDNEFDPIHLSCRDSTDVYSGIYRVNVASGAVEPLLTKRDGWPACFPDDVALDAAGNIYVTDLTLSGVWKIAPDRSYTLWSSDPLLQWPAPPYGTVALGANDLVIDRAGENLYVATDGDPAIVRIPIRRDGTAGPATVVAHGFTALDGIELDERGNIYVSEILRSEISVLAPDGSQRMTIATRATAPLEGPTSLIYRNGALCVANMGWQAVPEPRTVVCISGFLRPGDGAAPLPASRK
jgi:sugar lactone lactonase YvrE